MSSPSRAAGISESPRVPAGSPAEPLSPFEFPRVLQQSRGYH
jgi:hypothetical protein